MFEQFNQDLKALLNKEEEAKKQLDRTRREINELKDKFCTHLTASFSEYIGKKVAVTGHYSLIYRIKKDGEQSKKAYGQFDTPKLDEAIHIEFYVE